MKSFTWQVLHGRFDFMDQLARMLPSLGPFCSILGAESGGKLGLGSRLLNIGLMVI